MSEQILDQSGQIVGCRKIHIQGNIQITVDIRTGISANADVNAMFQKEFHFFLKIFNDRCGRRGVG